MQYIQQQLEQLNKEAGPLTDDLSKARNAWMDNPSDEARKRVYDELRAEKEQLDETFTALAQLISGSAAAPAAQQLAQPAQQPAQQPSAPRQEASRAYKDYQTVVRQYAVRKKGMKNGVQFQAPANATLDELKQAIRKAVPSFKRPHFTVWHNNVQLTTDQALGEVVTNTPVTKPVLLQWPSQARCWDHSSRDLLEQQLGVVSHDGMPVDSTDLLSQIISEAPPKITHTQGGTEQTVTFGELIDVIVHLFIFRLEAMCGFPESELNHRGFIDAIMVASVLVAREHCKDPRPQVKLKPEGALIGCLALGKVDWLVVYRTLAVLVMQAKKGEVEDKALGQLYREIRAMRDNLEAAAAAEGTDSKKRTAFKAFDLPQLPSYTVLCTAKQWHVVKYAPAKDGKSASIKQCALLVRVTRQQSHNNLKADITHAVRTLAGVLIEQMTALDQVVGNHPGLLSAGDYTADEMKDVDIAEAEAALEEAAEREEADEELWGEEEEEEEEEEETEDDQWGGDYA